MKNASGLLVLSLLLLPACEKAPGSEASSTGGTSSGTSGTVPADQRRSIDAPAFCTRLIQECGQPFVQADCVKLFGSARVSQACVQAIEGADCRSLTQNTPTGGAATALDTCFPSCQSSTLAVCNGDGTLTQCTSSALTLLLDCEASCRANGFAGYSGTCGKSFGSDTSAVDQCWCK